MFVFSILWRNSEPHQTLFRVGKALKQAGFRPIFGQNQQDRPGFAFTFVKHRGKASGGANRPDQARHFEVGGQPPAQAASFSIELDSSA